MLRTSPTSSGSSADGRLVEQHELGLHGKRSGDRHALLLAAGELARIGVGTVGEADLFEQSVGSLGRDRPLLAS